MRLKKGYIEVDAIGCKLCGEIIYSRHIHDMRYCGCGSVAIDGGRDYTKVSAVDPAMVTNETLIIKKGE